MRIFFLSLIMMFPSIVAAECKSGDCQNGTGTFHYEDGGNYEGSFKEGYRSGEGTYIWASGSKYQGSWERGNQNGKGTSYFSDGSIEHTGTWANGLFVPESPGSPSTAGVGCISGDCQAGFGNYVFSNGQKYQGSYKGGLRNGLGHYLWTDGSQYLGFWENDQQNGLGTLFKSDGTVDYAGTWQKGARAGSTTSTGTSIQQASGCVSGDCANGTGVYVYSGGERYEGGFQNGQPHGQGNIKWTTGDFYKGEWVQGLRTGYGTVLFADGSKYEGGFKQNKFFGQGIYVWADGSRYEGGYEDDQREGQGIWYDSASKVLYSGLWSKGSQVAAEPTPSATGIPVESTSNPATP